MDKNPYDKMLDQIAELMQFAYDNAHKPVSPKKEKELEANLEAIEKQVEEFTRLGEGIIQGSGVTDYVYEAMLLDETSEGVTEDTRKLLNKAEELKKEAKKASQNVLTAAAEAKAGGKRLNSKKKKEKDSSPQTRKGKFKSLGGYKNWKPL